MARILLVEDEDVQRKALEAILKSADHQVLLAGNGNQALLVAQDKKPDLILTDLAMPKMDGKALCQAVRAAPGLEGTYIIVVTGIEGEAPRLESLLAGADDYIRKPVNKEELLHRVLLGAAARTLRREVIELRSREARFTQAQDLLAASLDAALQGIEEGLSRLNTGDAIAAMNQLRAAHESVRVSLSKIILPEA
jgi:DNA-binding response OmpR family regulator